MKKKFIVLLFIVLLTFNLSGCAAMMDLMSTTKEELVGNEFEISVYDHYANKTLLLEGSKVTVGLLENWANFDSESTGYKSEVLEVTINGNQMFQVGNTVIFAEKGLDMIEDFDVPSQISVTEGGSFVPFDRLVNNIKNKIGKEKTVIISSQMGIPIGVYQGEEVYVTVPEDLPKMTRLNIDGKSLYIHRANYTILDSQMIK